MTRERLGIGNAKSEGRNPKEIRIPKKSPRTIRLEQTIQPPSPEGK
jgi:hypothetical protein